MAGYLVKHCSWVCLWECFWKRLALELIYSIKQVALHNVGGHLTQSTEGLNSTEKQEKVELSLLDCFSRISVSSCLRLSWLQNLRLALTSTALALSFSNLQTIPPTYFPGSPACRWLIMGLLSLHSHVSQGFIFNLSVSTFCIYIRVCTFLHM